MDILLSNNFLSEDVYGDYSVKEYSIQAKQLNSKQFYEFKNVIHETNVIHLLQQLLRNA